MPALGQKHTCAAQKVMSALPPKADMCGALTHICFVPIATHAPQQKGRYSIMRRYAFAATAALQGQANGSFFDL